MQINRGFVGRIDVFGSNEIGGWLTSAQSDERSMDFLPLLFVDGRPARLHQWRKGRGDVNRALGIPGNYGFTFRVDQAVKQGAEIELYASDGDRVVLVHRRTAEANVSAPAVGDISQILNAKEIAEQPNSVAITCWDGGHNPIGRAMVLHDCAATKRPVVLFAYLFPEFGGSIWPPIDGEMFSRVLIPWDQRTTYLEYIRALGIEFSTVWMCKPRLPTFELAANISGTSTRFILDHDDNELHFSRSQPKRQFGFYAMSLANHLASKVTSNTVASVSLAEEIENALIVRHARNAANISEVDANELLEQHAVEDQAPDLEETEAAAAVEGMAPPEAPDIKAPIKIGFIGTVREHKGLLEAARLIRLLSWESGQPYEFHVYGDFNPESLRDRLAELGAITHGQIPREELTRILRSFDVILSGCAPKPGSEDITRYQISSKIGDALAVERPVLVPNGPSVADLGNVPGVYLYESGAMGEAIQAAIKSNKEVELPPEFTLDGAFKAFEQAEGTANFLHQDLAPLRFAGSKVRNDRTLVLLWKQTDAGFFGRRVDQLARTYREKFPDHRVIVLETCHKSEVEHLQKSSREFTSPNGALLDLTRQKRALVENRGGVEYHMIVNENIASMRQNFETYIMENELEPNRTRFVVYPLIKHFKEIAGTLSAFDCVIDCVDNQLPWNTGSKRVEASVEYYKILKSGSKVIFNSQDNHDFFMASDRWGDLAPPSKEDVLVAPNWYGTENGVKSKRSIFQNDRQFKVIYSGNLSDRIDWDLMDKVARQLPEAEFHIVGGIRNPNDEFDALLEHPNVIYWGPLSERRLADLLTQCRVGIVPHFVDEIAQFMNPLKVHMYREFGLPVISTKVPGIAPGEGLSICDSHDEFISKLTAFSESSRRKFGKVKRQAMDTRSKQYIAMLGAAPKPPSVGT